MSKYELSISPDYVREWGVTEAVREIFQNALDQQTLNKDNTMFCDYNADKKQLIIGNKNSTISHSSLLLGYTTKSNESKTIGQFGEGYKIALLIFTRENKPVTIYNYGIKEIWKPRFVKSRRYGADVLTIFTEKHIWKSVPDNNLSFVIDDISQDEYDAIVDNILHLQPIYKCDNDRAIYTDIGNILLDPMHKNSIYVEGLFVGKSQTKYGYDIKSEHVTIGRDRDMISDFDLKWVTSKMWIQASKQDSQHAKLLTEAIHKEYAEVEYVSSNIRTEPDKIVTDVVARDFYAKYGDNAIPVSSNSELVKVSKCTSNGVACTPIIVPRQQKSLIEDSNITKEKAKNVDNKASTYVLNQLLEDMLEYYEDELSECLCKDLKAILSALSDDWTTIETHHKFNFKSE